MATTLTVAGNTIDGLDSFTAVVDATTQLSKKVFIKSRL
jgi:hypothetical protein